VSPIFVQLVEVVVELLREGKGLVDRIRTGATADAVVLHVLIVTPHRDRDISIDFSVPQFITSLIIGGISVVPVSLFFRRGRGCLQPRHLLVAAPAARDILAASIPSERS